MAVPTCRHAALLLLALLGGCAELRAPAAGRLLPADLVGDAGDPARGAVVEAAAAFRDGSAAIAGRPAEAARALALLEYLAAEVPASPRFAAVSPTIGLQLATAREEARAAIGLAPEVTPARAIGAYAAAARALRGRDRAAAARALPPPEFQPGGEAAVARLGALGPLPTAGIATGQAAEALRLAGRDPGWGTGEVAIHSGAGERGAAGLTVGY